MFQTRKTGYTNFGICWSLCPILKVLKIKAMIPSKKQIDELKELVKRDFGVEWTDQEASDEAFNLLNFYDALARFAMEDIQKYIDTGGEPSFAGPDYDIWLAEQAEVVKKIQASKKIGKGS